MLGTTTLWSDHDRHRAHRASLRVLVGERSASRSMLACYLEGWVEADPAKIADATADDYDFYDPLVGHFSRRTLPQYFALLRARFAIAGVAGRGDLAFVLRGPMSDAAHVDRCQYWREAPLLGLTGVSNIVVTHRGVAAEAVAYDLNIACERLRGVGRDR